MTVHHNQLPFSCFGYRDAWREEPVGNVAASGVKEFCDLRLLACFWPSSQAELWPSTVCGQGRDRTRVQIFSRTGACDGFFVVLLKSLLFAAARQVITGFFTNISKC